MFGCEVWAECGIAELHSVLCALYVYGIDYASSPMCVRVTLSTFACSATTTHISKHSTQKHARATAGSSCDAYILHQHIFQLLVVWVEYELYVNCYQYLMYEWSSLVQRATHSLQLHDGLLCASNTHRIFFSFSLPLSKSPLLCAIVKCQQLN